MMQALEGRKTYIAALALAAFAVLGLATGQLEMAKAVELLLQAAAIAGLRNALPSK